MGFFSFFTRPQITVEDFLQPKQRQMVDTSYLDRAQQKPEALVLVSLQKIVSQMSDVQREENAKILKDLGDRYNIKLIAYSIGATPDNDPEEACTQLANAHEAGVSEIYFDLPIKPDASLPVTLATVGKAGFKLQPEEIDAPLMDRIHDIKANFFEAMRIKNGVDQEHCFVINPDQNDKKSALSIGQLHFSTVQDFAANIENFASVRGHSIKKTALEPELA